MTNFRDEFIHQTLTSSTIPSSITEDIVKGFEHLDWDLAIRRNRDQLRQIVLALYALAGSLTSPHLWGPEAGETRGCLGSVPGLAGRRGVFPLFLPRSTIAMIMLVLRPAESAVRRLIVIVAAGLKLNGPAQSAAALTSPLGGEVPGFAGRRGAFRTFPLFDPLKSYDPDSIWDAEPAFESSYSLTKSITWHAATADHTPVDARPLAHRLNAILRALNDLSRQARRLKRWELKRDALLKASKPTRFSPMRPGLPPGWRERKTHEVDDVLKECHRLANDRLNEPDTG